LGQARYVGLTRLAEKAGLNFRTAKDRSIKPVIVSTPFFAAIPAGAGVLVRLVARFLLSRFHASASLQRRHLTAYLMTQQNLK
jgi:hypothetical protein